ncbi:MAG: hypothetical protein IT371_28060 [Deltaproteobacteria bacterium]|nr:hypothetical protein [Deltaproteobacteria bacterium]
MERQDHGVKGFSLRALGLACGTFVVLSLPGCAGHGGTGHVPAVLVGSWFAGAGGTTTSFDPASGATGTPNGERLLYEFKADGSYRKTYQSYQASGGCASGFTAAESGWAEASETTLTLTPDAGHLQVKNSCAPRLDSDKPLDQLAGESFTWTLVADELDPSHKLLRLVTASGAGATLRAL